MIAGMVPMALGWSEGGEQTAPLARAVIGGLVAATLATLVVLPTVFAIVQGNAGKESASIDPADPNSSRFEPAVWAVGRGALIAASLVVTISESGCGQSLTAKAGQAAGLGLTRVEVVRPERGTIRRSTESPDRSRPTRRLRSTPRYQAMSRSGRLISATR